MHLASVSKFLTAAGTVHLLDAKSVAYDTPIVNYLPGYWSRAPTSTRSRSGTC